MPDLHWLPPSIPTSVSQTIGPRRSPPATGMTPDGNGRPGRLDVPVESSSRTPATTLLSNRRDITPLLTPVARAG